MSDSSKIHIDDVHVSIRPEEIDSILSLRNTFDYFELLGNYVPSYLDLGWVVKLVIPHLDISLDLDFHQVREVWNQGLTDLAVKGIHACLMVFTGTASNLMVLEVQGRIAEKALILGRDWRAQCVIDVGEEREQHFFTWPQALSLPNQAAIENMSIQVYGEGGRVPLPPSLVPGAQETSRWLVPPWEKPPAPPTPRLVEFLKGHFPSAEPEKLQEPDLPEWEEIFAHISPQPRLMQTLLTPVANSEEYYRMLLGEARHSGLQDERLLLGLLWHAPLGAGRHDPNALQRFKDLIAPPAEVREEPPGGDISQVQQQLAELIKELSSSLANLKKEREHTLKDAFKNPYYFSGPPDQDGSEKKSRPLGPKNPNLDDFTDDCLPMRSQPALTGGKPNLDFTSSPLYLQGEIPVNRKQYEAMIYELGRLGALEKFNHRFVREANSLKAKAEAQRQEEIDHLRQMIRDKKNTRWW